MKVTVKQQPEEFKPVTLEITLESRKELETLLNITDSAHTMCKNFKMSAKDIMEVTEPIYKQLTS